MRQKLTDRFIQNLPHPKTGSVKYWDSAVTGFGIRVSQASKSFFLMYGTERRLKTLGKYPLMSLKTARSAALTIKTAQTTPLRPQSLREARTAFLEECEKRLRPSTLTQYRTYLSQLDRRTLADVKRTDIDTTHPHTVAAWKAFYNWCIRNELTDRNPFAHISTKTNQRERVLTHDEIKQLWHVEDPTRDRIRLLLLTGLRRSELNRIEVGETLKIRETKNKYTHELPLTPLVSELVPVPYFNGWSKAKARLDKLVPLPHWTLHDLRRSFATEHAKIGTAIHIVEALLNHRSGTVSGIAAIYIRHNFLDAALDAQLAYEKHLTDIVGA